MKQLAKSLTEPWITTRASKRESEEVCVVGNLGCQISDCYSTEEGIGGYETTMQYDWLEKQKSTAQMLHMLQHVCLAVRLLHSTHVIDECKNKTNMSKLHTITMYFIAL